MLNIMKYYKVWFAVSAVFVVASIVALSVFGLKAGIDFTGGSIIQMGFTEQPQSQEVAELLRGNGFTSAVVQPLGEKSLAIRTPVLTQEEYLSLQTLLGETYEGAVEEQYSSIGPIIGQELKSKAVMQLILVSLGIIFYIAYAFRKVTRPVSSWRFGAAAIVALLHDLIIVLGVFAVLGHVWGVEVDSLFITAILTVLGFSVHDTIVVFDRIRENMRVRSGQTLTDIINGSISQTLVRSINTTVTVLFVLIALIMFGGESIRYFVLTLLIGITIGTFSSIFIASPILLAWHNWDLRRQK
jgi:preprotein translocase subunit SecF